MTALIEATAPGSLRLPEDVGLEADAVLDLYPVSTPAGEGWIGLCKDCVAWLSLGSLEEAQVRRYWPGPVKRGAVCPLDGERLTAMALGRAPEVSLLPLGTPFQRRVWEVLTRIPPNSTRTYAEIAAELGSRKRARAVGTAVGANPIAWLIPCHRVLPARGGTGGYRWGKAAKVSLLEWEQQPSRSPSGREQMESRRKLESMLLNAKRFEDVSRIAGDIAHDLNNLLAPIRMATQLLKPKLSDRSLDRYVEIIETSTGRARAVIQEILSFSRETEETEQHLMAICPLVHELERIVGETFPKGILSRFQYPVENLQVRIDPIRLHRAILNVLVNARDAMKGKGILTVQVGQHDLAMTVRVGDYCLSPGPFVCISITDTGTGIAPEIRERIFDPFFTTKSKDEGTGLGLASVYGIIARAGGFIDLDTELGRGSTFRLYLPRADSSS